MPNATVAGTLAANNGAPPSFSYPPAVQALILPAGQQFVLSTTARVYLQSGVTDDTCCAHAVASAMETRMVTTDGLAPSETPVDPVALFHAGHDQRSLNVSRQVAQKGVVTPLGIKKAETQLLGAQSIQSMVGLLTAQIPLMVNVQIGPNFRGQVGSEVYRPTGALSPHAMCILGYGTHGVSLEPYWIAKNSYGANWGDHGFALVRWGDPDVQAEATVIAMRSVK